MGLDACVLKSDLGQNSKLKRTLRQAWTEWDPALRVIYREGEQLVSKGGGIISMTIKAF